MMVRSRCSLGMDKDIAAVNGDAYFRWRSCSINSKLLLLSRTFLFQLSYDPSCPFVGRLVGRLFGGWSVCLS